MQSVAEVLSEVGECWVQKTQPFRVICERESLAESDGKRDTFTRQTVEPEHWLRLARVLKVVRHLAVSESVVRLKHPTH